MKMTLMISIWMFGNIADLNQKKIQMEKMKNIMEMEIIAVKK